VPVPNRTSRAPDIINWTPQLFQTVPPVFERITAPKALHVYPDLRHIPYTDFNAHAMHGLRRYLGARGLGPRATYVWRAHSLSLVIRAPSARAPSFAQAMVGTTVGAPAKVAKPQSTPATTFSRPTSSA
jgi:hypothetical protein